MYITEYKAIASINLRSRIRSTALDVFNAVEQLRQSTLNKKRIQFIYLHHVFQDEEENLGRLIRELAKQHRFISYSNAVKKILAAEIDAPYICFSTDDGFRNNLKAAEIFTRYGIQACFFVCPEIINADHHSATIFCRERLHLPAVEFLKWNDIEKIMKMGHEIGSHTMSHINFKNAAAGTGKAEIEQSKDILDRRCGNISHFAYPYGRYFHFNRHWFDQVFAAGYRSCASAERGCHMNGTSAIRPDQALLRRDQVILNWKMGHIRYFLERNARNKSYQSTDPLFT